MRTHEIVKGKSVNPKNLPSPPYPLQTRAIFLKPDACSNQEALEKEITRSVKMGYNTFVLPAMMGGKTYFPVNSDGSLKNFSATSCRILEKLAPLPVTVWLYIDFLTAGSRRKNQLGPIAKSHRDWLARSITGDIRLSHDEATPSPTFCWMTREYRRFLGNFLVSISESFPFDGLVVDLRPLPVETEDPSTWLSMSFDILDRMPRELGFDVEEFLTHPTRQRFNHLMGWRMDGLEKMLETLKARTGIVRTRQTFLTIVSDDFDKSGKDRWIEWYRRGLIESVALDSRDKPLAEVRDSFKNTIEFQRPYLHVLSTKGTPGDFSEYFQSTDSSGFITLNSELRDNTPEIDYPLVWNQLGALESHPAKAVEHLIESMDEDFDLHQFLPLLRDFQVNPATMKLFEARNELKKWLKDIKIAEIEALENKQHLAPRIELAIRLLSLAFPLQEYIYD